MKIYLALLFAFVFGVANGEDAAPTYSLELTAEQIAMLHEFLHLPQIAVPLNRAVVAAGLFTQVTKAHEIATASEVKKEPK